MTGPDPIDIKQCPVCKSVNIFAGVCQDCGYDNSMANKFQYTLTLEAPTGGEFIVTLEDGTPVVTTSKVPYGTVIIVTAIPLETHYFYRWGINGVAHYGNPVRLVVNKDLTIAATFTANKKLTIGTICGGVMLVNGAPVQEDDELYFKAGESMIFLAIPNEHFEFDHWLYNGTTPSAHNPETYIIVGNTLVALECAIKTHTVTLVKDEGAVIEYGEPPLPFVTGDYSESCSYAIIVTPPSGLAVYKVVYDNQVITEDNGIYEIVIADHDAALVIACEPIAYTLTVAVNDPLYGAVVASPEPEYYGQYYRHGAGVILTAQPESGYHLDHWTDSVQAGPDSVHNASTSVVKILVTSASRVITAVFAAD